MLLSWEDAIQRRGQMQADHNAVARLAWSKSPAGWMKCNVDAAFSEASGSTRLGMCLRDHGGNFILVRIVSFNPQLC